jgi:hypothetical protein
MIADADFRIVPGGAGVPLTRQVALKYDNNAKQIVLRDSFLTTPHSRVDSPACYRLSVSNSRPQIWTNSGRLARSALRIHCRSRWTNRAGRLRWHRLGALRAPHRRTSRNEGPLG